MQNKETEIVVTEKKVPMNVKVREQVKLYMNECVRAAEKPLMHLAEDLIGRMIDWFIDAVS